MKDKKIFDYIKSNYKNILFILSLILISFFLVSKVNTNLGINLSKKYKYLFYIIIIFVQLMFFILIKKIYSNNVKIEKIFLIIAIPIGFLYLLLIPVSRVPDEQNHFLRAYDISEGHLISKKDENGNGGSIFKYDLVQYFKGSNGYIKYKDVYNNIKKEKVLNTEFIKFENTSLYSFICYLPQTIGILISKILSLPVVFSMYLGRLSNFIVWLLLIYLSIKKIPYKKISIMLFAFMPMMLQEAISLSLDALTNSMAIFLVSYVLYLKNRSDKLDRKDYLIVSLSSIIMSMCKIVYLPICLIVLLIPFEKFKSKKDKYIKIIFLMFIVLFINIVWLTISSSYLIEFNQGVNSASQLKFILSNPILYLHYLFNTICDNIMFYVNSLIGFALCYFNVNISLILIFMYIILLIYAFIVDNDKKIDSKDKLLSLIICISTILLIFTSLYIQWTPVGKNMIDGVQGRYFIPILLPLSILCNNVSIYRKENNKKQELFIIELVVFINICSLITIFFYHI